jgi:hypothetical protein
LFCQITLTKWEPALLVFNFAKQRKCNWTCVGTWGDGGDLKVYKEIKSLRMAIKGIFVFTPIKADASSPNKGFDELQQNHGLIE